LPGPPSSNAFNIITYTGNGSNTRAITGVGFKPDLVYIKERTSTSPPILFDSSRGAQKFLQTSSTATEVSDGLSLKSFDSDGFTVGSGGEINQNGIDYVAWCWGANGGTTSSNTDGSVTSTVQVFEDAGFSIIEYVGDGGGIGGSGTVGHGLGHTPRFIIGKARDTSNNWICYLSDGTDYFHGYLDSSGALVKNGSNTQVGTPNDTTIGISHIGTNAGGVNYMYWAWTPSSEYSSFGSFTGNGTGSASNPIQNLGFRPDFVLLKNATDGGHWGIFDSARGGTGQNNKQLTAESNGAEYTGLDSTDYVKFEDTGFRATTSNAAYNGSGKTIIYAAFKIIS